MKSNQLQKAVTASTRQKLRLIRAGIPTPVNLTWHINPKYEREVCDNAIGKPFYISVVECAMIKQRHIYKCN